MQDTRETLARNLTAPRVRANNEDGEDIPPEHRPAPRFKAGDVVRIPIRPGQDIVIPTDARWDYAFSGWLVYPRAIGIHESNFVLASEVDEWEPHANGLWSYWTRKVAGGEQP